MRVPRAAARFNRRITNRLMRPLARFFPTMGVLGHVGRTSGKHYETPLNIFKTADGFIILMGYGPDTNWAKNVLAGGRTTVRLRGQAVPVGQPRLLSKAEGAELVVPSNRFFYRLFPYNESAILLTREPATTGS